MRYTKQPADRKPGCRTARITALLLALVLFLGVCAGVAEEAEDPAVITVGKISYPLSWVQFAVKSAMDAAQMEQELTETDRQELLEATVERLTGMAVIENRLMELGLYAFTEDEEEMMMSHARQQYDQTWQSFYQQLREEDATATEETCTDFLNAEGYTVDAFYREILLNERELRLLEVYCGDITVTAEDVVQFYLENYVNPEKEKYEHNIPLYESEMLMKGNEAFYVPEGYRYVKHILLAWPEGFPEEVKPWAQRMNAAKETLQKRYQELADAAVSAESWEELLPAKMAFQEAQSAFDREKEAFLRKREEALQRTAETTDEILRRYQEGATFEELMREYSTDQSMQNESDPGFPFHPDSPNWPDTFREAAAALKAPGDVSDPVITDAGIHIIRYQSDLPGGAHQLTPEEQEALEEAALLSAKRTRLMELVAEWLPEYETECHPELLSLY